MNIWQKIAYVGIPILAAWWGWYMRRDHKHFYGKRHGDQYDGK